MRAWVVGARPGSAGAWCAVVGLLAIAAVAAIPGDGAPPLPALMDQAVTTFEPLLEGLG